MQFILFSFVSNQTPLHVAARTTNYRILLLLLSTHMFDINIPDKIGWTPLHYAASHSSLKCISLLLEHGASIDAMNDQGLTPVDLAINRHSSKIIQKFYSKKTLL